MPANDLIVNELLSHHNNVRIYGQIVRVSLRPLSISKGSDPFDKNKSPAGRPAGQTRIPRQRYMGGMGGAAGGPFSSPPLFPNTPPPVSHRGRAPPAALRRPANPLA